MTQQRGLALKQPRDRISYEAYLDADDLPEHTEWVDGEVVPMVGVTKLHNECALWLKALLTVFCGRRSLGQVFDEPYQMQLRPGAPGRSPDIMFLRAEHLDRTAHKRISGPADVVIEVISPGSQRLDRVTKFGEYERGGVGEYWIIDPHAQTADFYQLDGSGSFVAQPTEDGIYRSREIDGLWLKTSWLWAQPDLFETLTELLAAG